MAAAPAATATPMIKPVINDLFMVFRSSKYVRRDCAAAFQM
jgi:hypothetical protein